MALDSRLKEQLNGLEKAQTAGLAAEEEPALPGTAEAGAAEEAEEAAGSEETAREELKTEETAEETADEEETGAAEAEAGNTQAEPAEPEPEKAREQSREEQTDEETFKPGNREEQKPSESELAACVSALQKQVQEMSARQTKNASLLSQYIKENLNFQIQVREGMQSELDELRKEKKGEQYNSILKEIAEMYSVFRPLLTNEENADKRERNIRSLFSQMEELLEDYDAEAFETKPGQPRPLRLTKIMRKIPTADRALHDTVARSIRPGVRKEKLVLSEEYVEVFVYDEALAAAQEAQKQAEESPAGETAGTQEAEETPEAKEQEAAAVSTEEETPEEADTV